MCSLDTSGLPCRLLPLALEPGHVRLSFTLGVSQMPSSPACQPDRLFVGPSGMPLLSSSKESSQVLYSSLDLSPLLTRFAPRLMRNVSHAVALSL